jgi:nucleoid-associated protein YgaU
MRISQLARSLGIPPSDIVEFLGDQNTDANSRLDQDVVDKVISHFAPEKLTEPVKETEAVEETPAPPVAEESTAEASLEVIRVSKVELQGLKVLGKIDLPAAKKKAEPTPAEQPQQEPRKEFQKRREQRDWKNPVEAKRQNEDREKERRKKEQAEKQKEKRTNHYYNKVKSVPTKAVRRFEEETVVENLEAGEPPKGLFGKFLRWLKS